MRSSNTCLALAALAVLGAASRSAAQPPFARPGGGPPLPPAFSPYLNLNRPGTNPAINYFGIVRPQIQANSAIQSLQTQVNQINPYTAMAAGGEQPVITGNPFGFQNYRGYFQNQYAGGLFNTAGGTGQAGRYGTNSMGMQQFGAMNSQQQQPGTPPPRRR